MILIIMGVSGSGKTCVGTYLSEKLGWTLYEGDDYHSKESIDKMARGEPLTDQDRIPWLLQLHGIIQREITSKANAIVLCSALKRAYRQMLLFGRTCLPSSDSPTAVDGVWFAFLHGPFKLIQERLEAREGHYMSAALLQSQFDTLEPPVDTENAFSVDVQRSIPEVASDIESALSVRL
ncbi:probable gluconokinase [Scleropages formosus]|uniref:Gluconokinase n=1 Tax=Scleropages formosus TaxID=113540 RepID=A0A8C9RKP7_SCLFO|nr:probable gluconokinase [Scleropages formosus]